MIAEVLDAHRTRAAELRAETRLDRRDAIAAYVRRMLDEDAAVFAALAAAVPEERLDAEAIALVRLARVETGVPLASGGTVVPGIGWVQFPVQTGSLALLALGMQQQQAPLPGRDAIAAVRRALAPLARNYAEAWVSDWNRWIDETAALAAEHGGRLPPGAEGPITATRLQGPIERTRALVGALRSGDAPDAVVAEAVAAVASVTRRPLFPLGSVASERLRGLLERPMPAGARAAAIARLQAAWDRDGDPFAEDLELLRLVAQLDREDPPIDRLTRAVNAWRSREALARARLGVATVEAWRTLRAAGVEEARVAFLP